MNSSYVTLGDIAVNIASVCSPLVDKYVPEISKFGDGVRLPTALLLVVSQFNNVLAYLQF